ncbi:ATP-binding protein [Pseudonocardia adelaidensis]|uniref:ATP-binding protein n=1 Tax=Pseudonocardia adelaidensis TaxID=648754 RepID=A0ABP9NRW5_9PSEU
MSALARGAGRLRMRLAAPSLPERLKDIRAQVARWANRLGLSADAVDDIVLATHEALSNVADHAYPDGEGDAELDAACEDGEVRVVVRDNGRWRTPSHDPGWRGHGLVLIEGLAEHVDVHHAAAGTSIAMRWHLPDAGKARRAGA